MSTSFFPSPADCVTRYLLERHALEQPDRVFLKLSTGEKWTFAETLEQARRAACGLASLGVRQGDHVLIWLPNGVDFVRALLGANYLGAVYVPVNLAYRGGLLQHVVRLSDAKVAVVHAQLVERFADLDPCDLKDMIVVDGSSDPIPGIGFHAAALLVQAGGPAPLERPINAWDDMCIVFTSGTTGPSKAVQTPYSQLWFFYASSWPRIFGRDECYLLTLPLFHAGGSGGFYAQIISGGSLLLAESFKTHEFWALIRDHDVTTTSLMGAMTPFLLGQPKTDTDKQNPLRSVIAAPYSEEAREFGRRFNVDLYTSYSMSELSNPIVSGANPPIVGVAGRVRPGFQVRLVDDDDFEVAVGEGGEAVVRGDLPWMLCKGYYKNPAATAEAWRNGWFHTGDFMKRDAEGYFYFLDRKKDAIRRRGENISAYEVEQEVLAHESVREAAVIAVRSALTEDEVMLCVTLQSGHAPDPRQLIEFLIPRMPHYMVPRYVRFMDELPKTPTQKVRKYVLREEGVTSDAWDREAAGMLLRRDRIGG